ncbi:MAG: hypothetical protein ACJAWL_000842 [Motiliproteus sp.]|jgi:hypothetical protein
MATRSDFTLTSFALRYLFALLLVFATYNPSGLSWIHWLNTDVALVYKVGIGVVLLIGFIIYLRATWNSLGLLGTLLALSFFTVIIWLLIEWGLLRLDMSSLMVWVIEFVFSGVLAVGMSWSHLRRKLSGQYDTDEIEG